MEDSQTYTLEQIVAELKDYINFLDNSLSTNSNGTWSEYIDAVRNVHKLTVQRLADPTAQDVNVMTGSIIGLSRYFDEFYWEPNEYNGAKKYLHNLAILRVKLLESYGL